MAASRLCISHFTATFASQSARSRSLNLRNIWTRPSQKDYLSCHFSTLRATRETADLATLELRTCNFASTGVKPHTDAYEEKPHVDGDFTFLGGQKKRWEGKFIEVSSPIVDRSTGERTVIGRLPNLGEVEAQEALESAISAWDDGQGEWPQMSLSERIAAVKAFVALLRPSRESIIASLLWEICKNRADATSEFDRTMQFIDAVIGALRNTQKSDAFADWTTVSGVTGRVRRGPVGVALMLAPFNYPLNELYTMMIPALLMGNTVVLKLPTVGALAHYLTADAIAASFPPGVVNFITGDGTRTLGPIMKTGKLDCLGYIGGIKGVDALISQHPYPHRLKVFSQLAAKNLAIVLPDADLDLAADQITLGSLSYNGQRCTAIKLVVAHSSIVRQLAGKLVIRVNALKAGLPWTDGVKITPLPELGKVAYLQSLIADAKQNGAEVINSDAGGGSFEDALFIPAVLYPVTPAMRVFTEEQFGPIVPIATYSDASEVQKIARESWSGQQAAIFTRSPDGAAPIVDMLSPIVGRINLNSQCSRGPDVFPFAGRRSSAMGTMSVTEALRAFSVEVVLAYPENDLNRELACSIELKTQFFKPLAE